MHFCTFIALLSHEPSPNFTLVGVKLVSYTGGMVSRALGGAIRWECVPMRPDLALFHAWWKDRFAATDVKAHHAKVEAILASALASIHADVDQKQSFPYLNAFTEEHIRWYDALKVTCQELFALGAELYWLETICRLAQEDPTRLLLNEMAARLPAVNLTANLVRTLLSRAKSVQKRMNATKAPAARQSLADTLVRWGRAKGRAHHALARAMADAFYHNPLLELMVKDLDHAPVCDWTGLPALQMLRNRRRRTRGRPGHELAELCLVMLCDHLESRTKYPRYRAVAAFLTLLFPGWIIPSPSGDLEHAVAKRRRDFRKSHDVENLRAQVLKRYPPRP
jgi:hypothetical protein